MLLSYDCFHVGRYLVILLTTKVIHIFRRELLSPLFSCHIKENKLFLFSTLKREQLWMQQ